VSSELQLSTSHGNSSVRSLSMTATALNGVAGNNNRFVDVGGNGSIGGSIGLRNSNKNSNGDNFAEVDIIAHKPIYLLKFTFI
jgi:hypothetical protein